MKLSASLSLALFATSTPLSSACIPLTGLGTNGVGDATTIQTLKQTLSLPYLFLPLAPDIATGVLANEAPIQFRLTTYQGYGGYNVVAMYHPVALDVFGNDSRRLCTNDPLTLAEQIHQDVAATYAIAYATVRLFPDVTDAIVATMNNVLGLPYANLDLLPADPSTPWGLARISLDEVLDYAESDGWNGDGSLDAIFNQMPYEDVYMQDSTGEEYFPYVVQPSGAPSGTGTCPAAPEPWLWSSLRESNGKGYFTRQEHVTPHVGFTGRLFGMTDAEFASFQAPLPNYDYCLEADFVLSKTNTLATSDEQKLAVEYFDSKFTSLFPLQVNWSIQAGQSLFDFFWHDVAAVTSMYDATVLVWREKVLSNMVRPPTVVERLKADVVTQTYGGPGRGSQQVQGQDWQPYIRTMPHAEYPSGSSCACTAFAETLQLLSGSDQIGPGPLTETFAAGSSRNEPNVTPANDVTFTFTSWSQIQDECGASREYGGMHFSKAVPGGKALCSGVAQIVTDKTQLLLVGDPSGKLADLNDLEVKIRTPLDSNRDCTIADPCDECTPRDCDNDNQCGPGLLCADDHKQELKAVGLDKRRAYCGPPGVGEHPQWEVCYDPDHIHRDCTVADPCDECAPRDCDNDNQCAPGLLCADDHKQELKAMGLNKRRAYCGPPTAGEHPLWEVCYHPDNIFL